MAKRKSPRRRRARVSGFSSKDAGSLLMSGVLPGAAGAVALKMIADKVLPSEYQAHSNYIIGATGLAIALLVKNPLAIAAGLGAATVAGSQVLADLVDGQTAVKGLGLLRPGVPSYRIASPGDFNKTPNGMNVTYV